MEASFFAVIVAAPFAAALAVLWRIERRRTWSWASVPGRALRALVMLAIGGVADYVLLHCETRGTYVCTKCGRIEWQARLLFVPCSWQVRDRGEVYAARFAPADPEFFHEWHLESCLFSFDGVSCTMEVVEPWFRTLPALRDRELANSLHRQAQSLDLRTRCRYMHEFGEWISMRRDEPSGVEAAAADWHALWQSRPFVSRSW